MSGEIGFADIRAIGSDVQDLISSIERADFDGVREATFALADKVLRLGPDGILAPYLTDEDRRRIVVLTEFMARVKLGDRPVP
jgi:hypothetical protein